MQDTKTSLMEMAQGAFKERVDYELHRVVENILDENTAAVAKRKIQLTVTLVPDKQRQADGESGQEVGLFEADGGVWKLEAKQNIAEYFERELADLVESGQVVVMR
jgi:hypothetical protein